MSLLSRLLIEARRESDILFQHGSHWISKERTGRSHSYMVWRDGLTHATKVATIGEGPVPHLGFERAKAEAVKREAALNGKWPVYP